MYLRNKTMQMIDLWEIYCFVLFTQFVTRYLHKDSYSLTYCIITPSLISSNRDNQCVKLQDGVNPSEPKTPVQNWHSKIYR